ncbi:MAG TPA: patatin-like phospholipase family protein [Bdellovibrionales bacterium]|nr:patatin-like phospholipase family protein [Bdellovibrionales bacterium]
MLPVTDQRRVGLVLSGGGARGAYQAGVLKGIAEIAADAGIVNPLPIITGISAGAINAAFLASTCNDFLQATDSMAKMWSELTADRVFRTDALSAGRSGFKLLSDATVGALYSKKLARSLLDTRPLRQLLDEKIDFSRIDSNLRNGHLHALSITAMNYTNSYSTAFIQAHPDTEMWSRSRRKSELSSITSSHVLASAALPLFFPTVPVGNDYFGDGCLRNTAPLSPAIHLGADRLLVVSVRKPDSKPAHAGAGIEPSLARVLGIVLNALILDAVDVDMERMSRINHTLELIPDTYRNGSPLRKVDFLWIRPSKDIGQLAGDLFEKLPKVIKYLIRGLGSSKEASELTSYLLFDPDFCGQLVNMGYEDARENHTEILTFLKRG